MKPRIKFIALLIPYAVFLAAAAVVGSAFVVPDLVFATVGTSGLLLALIAVTASLLLITQSNAALRSVVDKLNNEGTDETTEF